MPQQRIHLARTHAANPGPNSLDRDDCAALQAVVRELAPDWRAEIHPDWRAEIHQDPVGEISLMIMPPDVSDEIGPLLVAHKVASEFRLDQFRWDSYSVIGEHLTFDGLTDAVRRTLLALPGVCAKAAVLH